MLEAHTYYTGDSAVRIMNVDELFKVSFKAVPAVLLR